MHIIKIGTNQYIISNHQCHTPPIKYTPLLKTKTFKEKNPGNSGINIQHHNQQVYTTKCDKHTGTYEGSRPETTLNITNTRNNSTNNIQLGCHITECGNHQPGK